MVRQIINTGSAANDGTGDTLRIAGTKLNANFRELYLILGDSTGAAQAIIHTDSGIDFKGTSAITKLGFIDASQQVDVLLPDSDGTLITDTSTATLTNKTIDSATINNPLIHDIRLQDLDEDAIYTIIPAHIAADTNVRLPALSDSDTFVFEAQTQTLTNKTFSSPNITTPNITTSINDVNTAEIIKLTAAASAVNEITINNAATSNFPGITASGTDTNVTMNLRSKGSGAIRNDKLAFENVDATADGVVNSNQTYIRCNKSSTLLLTMSNGTVTGEIKIFTNRGAGTATISPDNFAHGTSFSIPQYASAQCIWDGTNWYLTGSQGITVT